MNVNDQTMEEKSEATETNDNAGTIIDEEAGHVEETTQNESGESIEDSRIRELEKLADDNHQRYLRAQADFDNFRRRTQKEKEELAQYASMKVITQLLPIVDNFERALSAAKSSENNDSLSKGVDMIFRQLEQVLQQEGLKPMESVGQPFNPEYHQAIMQVESDEHEEGIVVEEIQKGYMLKEKVLRPAMVKVSG